MTAVQIDAVELMEVSLPLVRPFRTSFGEEREKRAILVRVEAGGQTGWGELVTSPDPRYSEEWNDGARDVLREFVVPAVLGGGSLEDPAEVGRRTAWVRGNRMAKAALETAVLDVWLRAGELSLAEYLGAVRDEIPCGVSIGITPDPEEMVEQARGYLADGYVRVKLKIEPGRDLAVVRRVRDALPDTPLSVDANSAYSPADAPLFEALDELDLVMIEQPLAHDDLLEHARLQSRLRTPICLDESIRHAEVARAAIELGACRVINIKPGRVGGLLESRRIQAIAMEAGIDAWVGGMLETGIGRAGNVALAALPGISMPGDTSASARYFAEDLTEPFVLRPGGTIAVPAGPGIGVEPLPERLRACTVSTERLVL